MEGPLAGRIDSGDVVSTNSSSAFARLVENLDIPVVVAPMFIVSNPAMVVASCREGMLGSFPAHTPRTQDDLVTWLDEIEVGLASIAEQTGKPAPPYGVNIVLHRSNPRAEADLEVICARRIPLVLTSKGAPGDAFARVHDSGGVVMHDVASRRHGEKALEAGADALIAVAGGAGGHCGTINPFALMNELRELTDKPIALAGAINTGADIFAARMMGAELAYLGTRFIPVVEANAPEAYKKMITRAASTDIVFTKFHRSPANILAESLAEAGFDLDVVRDHPSAGMPDGMDEVKLWHSIWSAGHGAGGIHDITSVKQVADRLKVEYAAAKQRAKELR